jgi:hypothetical protein
VAKISDLVKLYKSHLVKRTLPVIIGAVAGYAYYYFIGCYNGKCLISGNPYLATIYGAFMGALFAIPTSEKKFKSKIENETGSDN